METKLHIRVPVGLPTHVMTVALAIARERMPHLRIRWSVAEDPVYISGDTPDVIFHFGEIPSSGSWVSTVLVRR